ncbi:MAG: FHA domain-containing protein [candidate division Zixibacteria bacterium]|nr:FHA domain-containing protein [candidate division Zixibacteria bacterium]MCI0596692.1 FHA domain-containing protein [candidate division Zixibacteria bacterium]
MLKRLLVAVGLSICARPVWGQPVAERNFDLTKLAPDLEKPVSLWADSAGGFWVGDGKNKRVFCFGPEGELRLVLGDKKKNKIGFPVDLFGDRGGKIYILDSQERIVLIFDPSGTRVGQLGGSKTFARPLALALGDSDNVFIVEEARKKVLEFDAFKRPVAAVESVSAGQVMNRPAAAAADRQGNLFVLDLGRRSVLVYDGRRQFLQEVPLASGGRDFRQPVDLVSGPFGELFVLEAGEPAVWHLPSWRTPVWKKILTGEKAGLKNPTALVVTSGGKLFVLDGNKKELQKYSLKGLVEAVPEAAPEKTTPAARSFASSLGDSGHLLVPYADFKKGLLLLQPFDAAGNLADWLLDSDIRLDLGGEPLEFSSPVSLLKSDLKLAVALVWAAGRLSSEEEKELKEAFVREVHPELDEPNDKLFLFSAAGKPEALLEAEGNTRTAEMALRGLKLSSEGLCYFDAVLQANRALKERAPGLLPVIILVTDGADGASTAGYLDILHLAEDQGFANVYAVALPRGDEGSYLSDLRRVSEATQGIYFETPERKNVSQIFARIIKTLKYQLLVRFTPAGGGVLNAAVTLEGKTFSAGSAKRLDLDSEPAEEEPESTGSLKLVLLVVGILTAVGLVAVLFVLLVKKKGRKCPACGHKVETAWTVCYFCKTPLTFAKGPKGPATLTVQKGRLTGRRFTLTDAVITLGASSDNQIVLDYEGVSRRHARIEKNGGRWELVDLNSTNHTYVNGRPVSRSPLKNKDVVSLARVADMIFEQ